MSDKKDEIYDKDVVDAVDSDDEDITADITETEEKAKTEKNKEKPDDDEYEEVCFICRRPESKAGKMVNLPNSIQQHL